MYQSTYILVGLVVVRIDVVDTGVEGTIGRGTVVDGGAVLITTDIVEAALTDALVFAVLKIS
jgi:hypothetical protein